ENAQVDIPAAMIEDQIDSMLRDMEMRMAYQGMRMEDFLKYSGQTMDQMREMYKPQAEERVKTQLVLEAVKKAENIEPSDEDIEEELKELAQRSKKSLEEFKAGLPEGDLEYFREAAAMKKTLDLLKENAGKAE
ncbi:MAG TPA: trigger factor, partial [Candidatus Pullichristensenella excrementigallinarum]|nr:trigger factor [Candidatus Pullichristensenella excrementigallinarum]